MSPTPAPREREPDCSVGANVLLPEAGQPEAHRRMNRNLSLEVPHQRAFSSLPSAQGVDSSACCFSQSPPGHLQLIGIAHRVYRCHGSRK